MAEETIITPNTQKEVPPLQDFLRSQGKLLDIVTEFACEFQLRFPNVKCINLRGDFYEVFFDFSMTSVTEEDKVQ